MASVFVPVTNGAQISLQYAQGDNSFAENVFWVHRTTAWNSADLIAMAGAFATWWGTGDGTHSFKNLQNANMALAGVGYRDNTTQNGLSGVYQTGLPIQAVGSGAAAPLGTSFSITARTGLAGRSYRGRVFMVGLGANDFSNEPLNAISGTYAGQCVSALNALITAVPAADANSTLVVCSRFHQTGGPGSKSDPRAAGVTTPIATYGFHNLFMDFQRRRAPSHNRHG
jgi:hypothetical protein